MSLPAISSRRVDAYLRRIGRPVVRHDAEGLTALQAAHLVSLPFHNLQLLANDGRAHEIQSIDEVVDAAIAGVGGTCNRMTPPFAVLLRALGIESHLAAATIRESGDHFVCIARVGDERFLCDVGNGHPYMRPWRLDGDTQEQSFLGWRFRFEPNASAGPTLIRHLDNGSSRVVYVVDSRPRAYADFTRVVQSHYTVAGFGPFLTGLRAVSIHHDSILSLRDAEYTRDTRFGRGIRRLGGRDAVRALLVERIGLPPGLVADALAVLSRRRPELFTEPCWFALGRGRVEDSANVPRPSRDDVPDVLVSLATIGRESSVTRLLDTLAAEARESGYPGRVGVLIVENQAQRRDVPAPSQPHESLAVHRLRVDDVMPALERAARAGVLPDLGGLRPIPIGAIREAQLAALESHFANPVPGLPHPGERPCVVWMVDDDMAFEQLGPDGSIRRRTNLLFRIARWWAAHPMHSVLLGSYTGDPPVPGIDGLGGQLHDLASNVERMLAQGPDATWAPPPQPPHCFDAYYDLTEAAPPDVTAFWPYAPNTRDCVRTVALALLRDLPRLIDGQQLTRPLTWDGEESTPRSSLRRGGNTVFLDLDMLFRWPTPVMRGVDGVCTRRADTLWAALAQQEEPSAVVEISLPLLHGRIGQGTEACPSRAASEAAAQVRGIVLTRALSAGRAVPDELAAREARVAAQRATLRVRLARLRLVLSRLGEWSDPDVDAAVRGAKEVLEALDRQAASAIPRSGDAAELMAFLERLPQAIRVWRERS